MDSELGYRDGYCRSCGRRITQLDRFCAACGRPNSVLDIERSFPVAEGSASVGGWLLILSAVLSFISLPILTSYMDSIYSDPYDSFLLNTFYVLKDNFHYVAIFLGLMGFITIIGGISAILGGSNQVAMAGGIASVFGMSGAIGFAGLVIISASRNGQPEDAADLDIQEFYGVRSRPKEGEPESSSAESVQKSILVRR